MKGAAFRAALRGDGEAGMANNKWPRNLYAGIGGGMYTGIGGGLYTGIGVACTPGSAVDSMKASAVDSTRALEAACAPAWTPNHT